MISIGSWQSDSIRAGSPPNGPGEEPPPHAQAWTRSKDADLVARVVAGDDEAFATLMRPYLRLFTGGVHRILQEEQDTQQALQEAFLNIHAALHRFQGKGRFHAWAYRICLDEALLFRRSRMRRSGNNIEDLMPRGASGTRSMHQSGSPA